MAGKSLLFLIIGIVAAGIAIAGVWLPGVPTVFPLIVALWALSKSSPHLKHRLEAVPILRQALREAQRFEREKVIDKRVKIIAVTSAWVSTIVVALVLRNTIITVLVAGSAIVCSGIMLYIPSRRTTMVESKVEQEVS